jgi:hypothetical protein
MVAKNRAANHRVAQSGMTRGRSFFVLWEIGEGQNESQRHSIDMMGCSARTGMWWGVQMRMAAGNLRY